MQDNPIKVLVIEDHPGDVRLVQELLGDVKEVAGGTAFDLESVDNLSEGLERVSEGGIDLVLLDLHLPDSQGLETVKRFRAGAPHTAVVVMTSLDDPDVGLDAVQAGAQEYLVKGRVDGEMLSLIMNYALELKWADEVARRAHEEVEHYKASDFAARVLDATAALVLVLDRNGRIALFNKACELATGYASREIIGEAVWRQLAPRDDGKAFKEVFEQVIGGQGTRRHEGSWIAKNGQRLVITWDLVSVCDGQGAPEYVVGTGCVAAPA